MKKYIFTIAFLYCCNGLQAQTDTEKLSTGIRKLAGEWLTGFKNIRGALKSENEIEVIY
jgi:hypothetical protein